MTDDVFATAAHLRADGKPFVLATVVAAYAPQSVRPGAKAIIYADGSIDGWIGGGCVRPVIVQEAADALEQRTPRLVRMNAAISVAAEHGDVHDYAMTCQGEGGVEVYLEPVLPADRLVIFGRTPVARALARLGTELSLDVIDASAAGAAIPAGAWIVIATMGAGDEDALAAAVDSDAAYIGLVASRKKGRYLIDYVRASGVSDERLTRVKFPAGLDFGGTTPSEIALSILAEIEQQRHARRRAAGEKSQVKPAPVAAAFATDPICGMSVNQAEARHTLVVHGETIYFCCPHCKATYERRVRESEAAV